MRGQRNFLQIADFSVQAGQYAVARAEKLPADSRFLCLSRGYAGARAEKLSTDSRFLSPSLAYTVMWAEKIQNIRHIIDNISVQAGRYAVARAEKFSTDSRFLSPSRAVCCREGREIFYRQQISQSKPGVYCREGREIACRQQISLPKPGGMLSRGQKVRHTCAVKSVRKRIYLTRKNTCGSLVT